MAGSLAREGVIQPLVVVETPDGETPYRIVTGERRWRAARWLGEKAPLLPCLVRPAMSTLDQLVVMGTENLQREDMDPIAEGRYYRALLEEGLRGPGQIAARLRISRQRVKGRLELLDLPVGVQAHIKAGRISVAAARHLAHLPEGQQVEVANKMMGRKSKDVARVVRLIETRQNGAAPGSGTPRNGNGSGQQSLRDVVECQKKLLAQLWAQLRQDGKLLDLCADVLVEYDEALAEEALERANEIERAIRSARKVELAMRMERGISADERSVGH